MKRQKVVLTITLASLLVLGSGICAQLVSKEKMKIPFFSRTPVTAITPVFGPVVREDAPGELRRLDAFAYIDEQGNPQPFGSLEEMESWVRGSLELTPGRDILLYEQQIGDKVGLLIVGASRERIAQMRDYRAQRSEVRLPAAPPVPSAADIETAKAQFQKSLMRVKAKGQKVSEEHLTQLIEDFNRANAADDDPKVERRMIELLRRLAKDRAVR